MHQRRAHQLGLFLSRTVACDSCPNCCSTFTSRVTAINHVIRAYLRVYCPRNRRAHSRIVLDGRKEDLLCRTCHEWCTGTAHYHQHKRTRLPLPRRPISLFVCKRSYPICANAHRHKHCLVHRMAAQHRRRRCRHTYNHREQEQETASDRSRRFLWSLLRGRKIEGQSEGDEGQDGFRRPGSVRHRTTHATIGTTTPNVGSDSLGTYLISSLAPTIPAAKEAGRQYHLQVQSATASRRAELGPLQVHIFCALVIALATCLKEMTPLDALRPYRSIRSSGWPTRQSLRRRKLSQSRECPRHIRQTSLAFT